MARRVPSWCWSWSGELTDQISATVTDVKALLWGDTDRSEDILEVGLESPPQQDTYSDLLVR